MLSPTDRAAIARHDKELMNDYVEWEDLNDDPGDEDEEHDDDNRETA